MRRALQASALFNLGGAILFAFPSSPLGRLVGLPAPVPALYRGMVALFVLLFGGMYAWLSRREPIDRPMVALAAIGKASAFTLIGVFWVLGHASGRGTLLAGGDLIFAGIFAAWLVGRRTGAQVGSLAGSTQTG